jgi:uncharacterized protein (TIGR03435 family)
MASSSAFCEGAAMPRIKLLVCLLLPLGSWAQSLQFEVASIRPHEPPLPRIQISTAGSTLTAECYSLFNLITYAYNLRNYQVSFAPANSSIAGTFYDIAAKAEGDTIPTRDEFGRMMQSLLADRFKLKVHHETREMQVYALVVGKNGPKLKDSAPDANPMAYFNVVGRNYRVTRAKATMDDVVQAIGNSFLDRPVLDQTGLTGTYNLSLTYTPDIPTNRGESDPNDISIFTAVQEQLGLKLEPQKASIEILVVDSVEKPSEN